MENLPIDNSTLIFAVAILLSPYFLKRIQTLNTIANTVVSLGILGTFSGIFLGLLYFDVSNISASVPQLLTGLKTAFLTSIAGLVSSLILKSFPQIYGIKVSVMDTKKDEANIETMINLLSRIEKAIAGEGETTLVTQVQKLRTSNADRLDKLDNSFNDFAEKMVADSTQSLIDALTQVMKDFNTQINEQFGDNFKQLNDAVGKMLEWQKEYAGRVESMTDQFQRTLSGIVQCEQVLTSLTKKAAVYQDTSTKLQELLSNLNTNLVAISEMSQNAKNAFPTIQKQIQDLTEHFSNAVESAVRENNRMFETQKIAIDSQINSMSTSYQQLGNQQQKLITELNSRIEKLMKDNADRITEQLKNLDDELADELNKALTSLGSQLTSLSDKFVKDYTPLTQELQKLVQMASRKN
jgi:DNA anti-recombination protein RmuC